MKRKILITGLIIVLIVGAYCFGFDRGQKSIREDQLELENNEPKEEPLDEKLEVFEKEGYIFKENLSVDIEDFKNVCYVVSEQWSRNQTAYKKRWLYV